MTIRSTVAPGKKGRSPGQEAGEVQGTDPVWQQGKVIQHHIMVQKSL